MKYLRWALVCLVWLVLLSSITPNGSASQSIIPPTPKESFEVGYSLCESHLETPKCPVGMIEIKGDYCNFAQEKCLKWIDADKKYPYMCEYFEFPTKCLSNTVRMNFCIDAYEAQGSKGLIPEVFIDWFTAKSKCEASGKRLCDVRELTLACEGPELKPYPYGYTRDPSKCNIGQVWIDPDITPFDKLDRRVPSGTFETCKSDFGVYDGVGNVDEWAIYSEGTLNSVPFMSALFGGHYVGGIRNRCRDLGVPSITASHGPTAKNYEISYRCCSNVPKL